MSFDNPTNIGVRNVDNLSQTVRLPSGVLINDGDAWATIDLSDSVSYALSLFFTVDFPSTGGTIVIGLQWWDRVGPDGEPNPAAPIQSVPTFYESVEVAASIAGLRTLLYNNCRGNFLTISLLSRSPDINVITFASAELTSSSKQVPRPIIQENSDLTDVPYSGLLAVSTATIGAGVLAGPIRAKLASGPLTIRMSAGLSGANNMRFGLNWGANTGGFYGATYVVVPGADLVVQLQAPAKPLFVTVRNLGAGAQQYILSVWAAGDF